MISPKLKTYIFTIVFSIIGIFMILKNLNFPALPLILFYVILLINTFFSIEFFSKISSSDKCEQKIVDFSMGAIYLGLILSLGNETMYLLFSAILFVVASMKYALLLKIVDINILRKKLIIDILGGIVCILALAGSLLGYGEITNWIWAILFLFANIYLLIIKPMYRL
jgi:hypothetical protein